MTQAQHQLMEALISALPASYQPMFRELVEFAISLGYTPKRTATKHLSVDFTKSKVKRTLMKIEEFDNGKPGNPPGLRLKFYAGKEYSDLFGSGIRKVIEEFDGKYTGCYKCGRCKGELEGYVYEYADGRKVFRCGGELIALQGYKDSDVPEIKRLLQTQDAYYMELLRKQ